MTQNEFFDTLTEADIQKIIDNIKPYADYLKRHHNKRVALRALYQETDELFTDIREDIRKEIKCTKGCAHCCHIKVVATELEAEVAIDYAKDKGLTVDKQRLEQQKDLSTEEYMFSPHKRCVFLQPDNTCGIYEVRPMACRSYFVVNEPKFCDTTTYPHHEALAVNNLPMAYPAVALMQHYPIDSFAKQLLKVYGKEKIPHV